MRLVSLCPSITESLVELGLRGELVGVTRYCVHPRDGVRGLARVGGTKDPDLARIRSLAPDLVFLNAEENRREDAEALSRDLTLDVSHPRTVAEVPDLLRRFGALTGRAAEAEAWARRVEAKLAEVRATEAAPFTYVYLIWKEPWMAAADGTYIADLLRVVGGRNAFGGGVPYPVVTEDAIAAAAPDLLLLPDEPYRFRESDREEWRARIPGADVRTVPGDDFCWHGVRTLRGLEAAAALAHSIRPQAARPS